MVGHIWTKSYLESCFLKRNKILLSGQSFAQAGYNILNSLQRGCIQIETWGMVHYVLYAGADYNLTLSHSRLRSLGAVFLVPDWGMKPSTYSVGLL